MYVCTYNAKDEEERTWNESEISSVLILVLIKDIIRLVELKLSLQDRRDGKVFLGSFSSC